MQKVYSILLSFIVISIILTTLFLLSDYRKVSVIEEEASFRSYYVNSDKVYFEYLITLKNDSKQPKEVKISANFKEEYAMGLIKEPELTGRDSSNGCHSFLVPAEATVDCVVEFAGAFTGRYQKPSKALPEFKITELIK